MRALNIITLVLLIAGGLNWGLIAIADFDLVTALFGNGSADADSASTLSRVVYLLVAASAVYQLLPLSRAFSDDRLVVRHT